MPSFSGALVIDIRPETTENVHNAMVVLFYILQKKITIISHIFLKVCYHTSNQIPVLTLTHHRPFGLAWPACIKTATAKGITLMLTPQAGIQNTSLPGCVVHYHLNTTAVHI